MRSDHNKGFALDVSGSLAFPPIRVGRGPITFVTTPLTTPLVLPGGVFLRLAHNPARIWVERTYDPFKGIGMPYLPKNWRPFDGIKDSE